MNREQLAAVYLDYINNYLTIEKFAEHYGLYDHEAEMLVALALSCHEVCHPES